MKRLGRPALVVCSVWVLSCGGDDAPRGGEDSGQTSGIDSIGDTSDTGIGEVTTDDAKLDVGDGQATAGPGDCTSGGGDDTAFSLIWIANSPEGTVSKIDTETGVELARYYTGPTNGEDDPSRTSVNLAGDVAVTNRGGGIAKIAANADDCVDANQNGMIETSTGPNDVLPFGQDECVLWHQPLPDDGDNRHGPRPTAWDAGGENNPCQVEDDRVWVGWWDYPANTGVFRRLSGSDGATLDEASVPNWDPDQSTHYGPYGGAVDGDGNFWVSGRSPGPLVRIDAVTLAVSRYEVPEGSAPYGIAMDAEGHPWLAGTSGKVLHFNPATETFDVLDITDVARMRGLQIDTEGYAWIAGNEPCGLIQIDTATVTQVGGLIPLPGCADPVGVSIDSEGYVWLPDRGASLAFKVNPADYATTTTMGLVSPYTYSDMTGAGLGLVTNPPAG